MVDEGWQSQSVPKLTNLLWDYPSIQAVLQYGSAARHDESLDRWSDVDILIVADALTVDRLTSDVEWTTPLGLLFAWEVFPSEVKTVLRLCFQDFSRFDLVFTTAEHLTRIDDWGRAQLSGAIEMLFCRDSRVLPWLAPRLDPPTPVGPSATEFAAMVHRFWFCVSVAVTKIVRDDLLIALHLTQETSQTCLVLRMILRDRETGTSHHRTGGSGNDLVLTMNALNHIGYDAQGLLDRLSFTAQLFDTLAAAWDPNYVVKADVALVWIQSARVACQADQPPHEGAPQL